MLIAEPTKYHAGVRIFGDYLDLNNLRETIHYLVEDYPIGGGESRLGEFVLTLAFDVRHAHQKDRETRQIISYRNDTVTYAGFVSLWPYLLPQVGLLRLAASYHPTNRNQQSTLFKLEACIEEVLHSIDPTVAKEVFDWFVHCWEFTNDYYLQFFDRCALYYVTNGRPGKTRFRRLPKALNMMSTWSGEYKDFASSIEADAAENNCSPHDLREDLHWPEYDL